MRVEGERPRRALGRVSLFLLSAFLAVGLAGCPGPNQANSNQSNPNPASSNGAPSPQGNDAKPREGLRVALVLDQGGVDDKSFNAAADAGLERAKKELQVEGKYVESHQEADYKTNLTTFASQNYSLVFAVGFKMENALKEVAPQFPNVNFVIIDTDAPDLPNCAGIRFKEEQGSFLAGFLAASMSKTKKIGFVGGENIALIQKFQAGYAAGAKTAGFDPGKQLVSAFTNNFDDLSGGKTQAQLEFTSGADIIYHAAGKAGLGVIEAAKEKGTGFYAIGVDRDQDDEAPGRVLTSMVKRLDNAVYDTIKRVKESRFEKGTHIYDLKENGVGLSAMRYTAKEVPADVKAKLDRLTKMIADGQVVVPTTMGELQQFTPPKL